MECIALKPMRDFCYFQKHTNAVTFAVNNCDGTSSAYRIKHAPLKKCPVCGSRARVKPVNAWGLLGFIVKCNSCSAESIAGFEGKTVAFENIPSKYVTFEEALQYAVDKWNTRTAGGDTD